jgi:peptide/nickel transport system ATP-binding protein
VIAHLCDRIAVMNRGEIVETTTAEALAAGDVTNPYTQQLLRSNRGFDPSGAELDLLDAAPTR